MEKNKSIALAVGMLIVGFVIGSAVGGRGDRDGRYGFDKGGRADKTGQYAQYGAPNQMMNGTHMMPNGEMMGNGGSMSMVDMMTSMNAELQGKTGDAFDQAFLSEMIVHHQGAVEMAKLALTNAKHQEIKDLAKAIIAAQNKEIGDMQTWQKSWFQQ